MHPKVFGKVTTKKEKNNNKKEKKLQEIGHNFLIDFLFFTPHEKKISVHMSEKNGQTPELARSDWLESLLAEEVNVTVVVNHFLLLHWDIFKNTRNTFIVTFCS